ncbi:hypothetical protein [Streptomyces sp. HUAS TT7]|uniref:hypothetical protein n=1 Tax=Streptomyces sp. HUAS TT7 TaxID=3447507 RepID=UPI003F654C33
MSTTQLDPQTLLGADTYNSVVRAIVDNNPGMAADLAVRITDQAVLFVIASAQNPDAYTAPSRVVDEGWHALLTRTFEYMRLCERFGAYVHHCPGYDPTHYDPDILDRTRALIEAAGGTIDAELWRGPGDELVPVAAKCQHAPTCAIRPMPKPEWP